jgi:hypothetical protein
MYAGLDVRIHHLPAMEPLTDHADVVEYDDG